jgi:hypothetical protein
MAKICKECGKKLPSFSKSFICKDCSKLIDEKYEEIKKDVLKNFDLKEEQASFLKDKFEKGVLLDFYNEIYNKLLSGREIGRNEIEFLAEIRDSLSLSNEDIGFDERIKPYIYINFIKEKNGLPDFKLETFGFNIILKNGEKVHFADAAILKEIKIKNLGYSGGRSGVSFKIARDAAYLAGTHKEKIVNENKLLQTSKGVLIITNKRIVLNPLPGNRPLSIPLDQVLTYQGYQNGIEIYKEDTKRGLFFEIASIGSVEIFGICLSFLLLGVS